MSTPPLRIVFAGTPAFAASHLNALLSHRFHEHWQIVGVFTQPDRRAGRGKQLTPGPVKTLALAHGLPVFQPHSLNDDQSVAELAALRPDVMVVVAYGLLLPMQVLQLPRYGCINVHASLLPRWRGAAPIERAILAGDEETGVCIMQMEEGLDTGPVLASRRTTITADDDAGTITERLTRLGTEALTSTLPLLPAGQLAAVSQDESLASYAAKLRREEAAIDWQAPAELVLRRVQAFYPRSPAYTVMGSERLMILKAAVKTGNAGHPPGTILEAGKAGLLVACGDDAILVTRVQLAGKKPMTVNDLLNGRREHFLPGKHFDSPET